MTGRNGRYGTIEELFAEPAYIRITKDGKREPVYVTERRWIAYLQQIEAQVERAHAMYDQGTLDEQGLGNSQFRVLNAVRKGLHVLAGKEGNPELVKSRFPEIENLIYTNAAVAQG